jgi:hypothetical protein
LPKTIRKLVLRFPKTMGEFKSKYNKKEEIQLKAKLSDLA